MDGPAPTGSRTSSSRAPVPRRTTAGPSTRSPSTATRSGRRSSDLARSCSPMAPSTRAIDGARKQLRAGPAESDGPGRFRPGCWLDQGPSFLGVDFAYFSRRGRCGRTSMPLPFPASGCRSVHNVIAGGKCSSPRSAPIDPGFQQVVRFLLGPRPGAEIAAGGARLDLHRIERFDLDDLPPRSFAGRPSFVASAPTAAGTLPASTHPTSCPPRSGRVSSGTR